MRKVTENLILIIILIISLFNLLFILADVKTREVILGGLISLFSTIITLYLAELLRENKKQKSKKEKIYSDLMRLRVVLRQTLLSRFEAYIYSDYHEVIWRKLEASSRSSINFEEARRWQYKSEDLVTSCVNYISELMALLGEIRVLFADNEKIRDAVETLYNYKLFELNTKEEFEKSKDLKETQVNAIKKVQELIENRFSSPMKSLIDLINEQL